MFIGKLAAIGLLGAVSVQAQMTNTTLLGILNTTQLSPANKFMELITSDQKYKPILDLLSNPGNHTIFVPSDKAFDEMAQQNATTNEETFRQQNTGGDQQPSMGESNGGGEQQQEGSGSQEPPANGDNNNPDNNPSNQQEGSGSQEPPSDQGQGQQPPSDQGQGQQQFANVFNAILPEGLKVLQQDQSQNQTDGGNDQQQGQNSTEGGNQTSTGNQTSSGNETYNPFTEGARANYTILNLIQYHIVNGSYLLKDLNDSSVLHSDLTNHTVDKNTIGLPIVISRHNVTMNSTEQDNSTQQDNGEQQQQSQITVLQDQQGNGTSSSGGGGDNSTSSGNSTTSGNSTSSGNNTQTVYHAGNGIEFSNVTLYDIKASNGILHVIDRVLVPPGKPTEVVQNVTNTSTLAQLVQQNNQSASQINKLTNITILAPTDEALSSSGIHASFQSLLNNYATSQDQIKKLVNAHIVKGVYYADNLTAVAHQHGHGNLVTNENNNKLELTPVNGSVQVNHTANIVEPNILTDNGVMHTIDHVLSGNLQQQQQNQTQGGGGGAQQSGASQQQPEQTATGGQSEQTQ